MTDERNFPIGTELTVLLNLQSFTNFGVVPLAGDALTSLVKRTCEVWNGVGANVRFKGVQYTNIDRLWNDNYSYLYPADHILIHMNEAIISANNILGTAGTTSQRGIVTLYYTNHNLTPYDWTMGFGEGLETEIFSVLLHELGHVLGLGHTEDDNVESVMHGGHRVRDYAGPSIGDIERLQALYGTIPHRRIANAVYGNVSGWIERPGNELTYYQPASGSRDTALSQSIAATPLSTTPLYYCVWNDTHTVLNTVMGDGTDFLMNRTWAHWYPTSVKTLNAPHIGSNPDASTLIWSWVRSDRKLVLERSNNHGKTWNWINQNDDVYAMARPYVVNLSESRPGSWIVFWTKFLLEYRYDELAATYYMISNDDGQTWSAPAKLWEEAQAVGGVAAVDCGGSCIAVAYSRLPDGAGSLSYGQIRVEQFQLNGTRLDYDRIIWSGSPATESVTEPDLIKTQNKLLLTWKDSKVTDIERTGIKIKTYNLGSSSWSSASNIGLLTTVAPTASYHHRWFEQTLWYADRYNFLSYLETPTRLEHVLHGAELVLVATFQKLLGSEIKHYDRKSRVESSMQFTVNEVLKGKQRTKRIKVRIVGGKVGTEQTKLSFSPKPGQQYFLALKRSRAYRGNVFVSYYDHQYEILDKKLVLQKAFRKELRENHIRVTRGTVPWLTFKKVLKKYLPSK